MTNHLKNYIVATLGAIAMFLLSIKAENKEALQLTAVFFHTIVMAVIHGADEAPRERVGWRGHRSVFILRVVLGGLFMLAWSYLIDKSFWILALNQGILFAVVFNISINKFKNQAWNYTGNEAWTDNLIDGRDQDNRVESGWYFAALLLFTYSLIYIITA